MYHLVQKPMGVFEPHITIKVLEWIKYTALLYICKDIFLPTIHKALDPVPEESGSHEGMKPRKRHSVLSLF